MGYKNLKVSRRLAWRMLNVAGLMFLLGGCAGLNMGQSQPQDDNSAMTHKLESLPPMHGRRKKVAIYRFRSSVPEIGARAATDMFTTALVQSHRFAVLERQRLNEGVMREKELNANGMSTGHSARHRLTGARYIFEGTISGANTGASGHHAGVSVEGLNVEGGGNNSVITIDVRVVDARSGAVLDAIDVHRDIKAGRVGVSGIGSFFSRMTHTNMHGADANYSTRRKQGVDRALRDCIQEAVYQLAKRFGS